MPRLLVSILIPTYNEERYIGQTLKSISQLEHGNFDIEVIVIDANSTDKTLRVVKEFNVNSISIERRGIGYARQMGLNKARGDIVAFTDADTVVPAQWLVRIVQELCKPSVAGVYGHFDIIDGWWVYRYFVNYVQRFILLVVSRFNMHISPGQNIAFWRKKAIKMGGFDTSLTIFEDIDLMTKLSKTGTVKYIPDLLVKSSGRRGNEGWGFFTRYCKSFWFNYVVRKEIERFPDFR